MSNTTLVVHGDQHILFHFRECKCRCTPWSAMTPLTGGAEATRLLFWSTWWWSFPVFVIYFCQVITNPNIHWKWKWSNIVFIYLSSKIMELEKMRGEVHILVNCPIDTFLKVSTIVQWSASSPFLDAPASLGSMLESEWVSESLSNVFEILSNLEHIIGISQA